MASVVLVEDDHRIRAALVRALSERGHDVVASATGMEGLNRIVERAPDLVILDLGLPDIQGSELLKMVRAVSAVPVIVATARDDDAEIVRTLDAGADDYVVKPFSAEHLDARMRAVLRRALGDQADGKNLRPDIVGSSVIATMGTPLDVSLQNLRLELYFPADAATAKWFARACSAQ